MLTVPTLALQSGMTCWAAALVSWLSVKPGSPMAWRSSTEGALVRDIRAFSAISKGTGKGELIHENGGLTKEGAGWVLENAGMHGKGFQNPKLVTGRFLHDKMRTHGHLYLIRIWGAGMCHAVVVHGIENWKSPDCTLWVMDPNPHWGGYVVLPLAEALKDHQLFVCWL